MKNNHRDSQRQIHSAAQYLAAAGKSFLEHREDDSHTNLGFNPEDGTLKTWDLDEQGLSLLLDYESFSLVWKSADTPLLSIDLDQRTHGEILEWISMATTSLGLSEKYTFDLHYDLPYEEFKAETRFSVPSKEDIAVLLKHRKIAQHALEEVIAKLNLKTSIRIWPHHFDTGAYVAGLGKTKLGLGFGMAIPDSLIDESYLYASGYAAHESVDPSDFKPLAYGQWYTEGFKGAILPMTNVDTQRAAAFMEEAIRTYINLN